MDLIYSPNGLSGKPCSKTSTSRRNSRAQDYKRRLPALQYRLYDLEKACWDHGVPTDHRLRRLGRVRQRHHHRRADPAARSARLQALPHHRAPHLRAAAAVAVALLAEGAQPRRDGDLRSQLVRPRAARARRAHHPGEGMAQAYRDIVEFERMLADDGTVILKFFLHISKKEQKKRFRSHRRPIRWKPGASPKPTGRATRNTTSTWPPPRRCWS